jgi:hypothetical protein
MQGGVALLRSCPSVEMAAANLTVLCRIRQQIVPARAGGPAMTDRCPCPSAPGPLEVYAAEFDALFGILALRRGFRAYLQGLLWPRDRN